MTTACVASTTDCRRRQLAVLVPGAEDGAVAGSDDGCGPGSDMSTTPNCRPRAVPTLTFQEHARRFPAVHQRG